MLPVAATRCSDDNAIRYVMYFRFVDDVMFSHNAVYFTFAVLTGCLSALYLFEGTILVLFSFMPSLLIRQYGQRHYFRLDKSMTHNVDVTQ